MHALRHSGGGKLDTPDVPRAWFEAEDARQMFRTRLQSALKAGAAPLLICDYDGTLAPFHPDKMQAYAYKGVAERLSRIAAGPSRLAFISGRPVDELLTLLPLAEHAEIWGMHGRQHRTPDGALQLFEPTDAQRSALDHAQQELAAQGYAGVVERKVGSVALHWRDVDALPGGRGEAEHAARAAFEPFAGAQELALLPFDGGLELRTDDRTKEHAADALLDGAAAQAAAFLGDDVTDEDAFRAVARRGGTALLVRAELRPSAAQFALSPPDELLAFLDFWMDATNGV